MDGTISTPYIGSSPDGRARLEFSLDAKRWRKTGITGPFNPYGDVRLATTMRESGYWRIRSVGDGRCRPAHSGNDLVKVTKPR